MNYRKKLTGTAIAVITLVLTACGGGGGSGEEGTPGSSGVSNTSLPFPLNVVVANARFLLYPNPQRQGFVGPQQINGLEETNTQQYTDAYYAAIVPPGHPRNNLTQWKNENGFGDLSTGVEKTVVFGDQKDLGYGRRMTARKNINDGRLAFMVDNYLVDTGSGNGYAYSSLNVDAAAVGPSNNRRHLVSTSAIEYSDKDGLGVNTKFVKFYVFDANGDRLDVVNQDGLGLKAMPNICVNCHGGRADPLTTANAFATVANAQSQAAGDTLSHLQSLKVHTFDFSGLNQSFIRSAQENDLREINQWVHDSYGSTGVNEWNGTVAQKLIQVAYGDHGATLTGNYIDSDAANFLPPNNNLATSDWNTSGQSGLYRDTVSPDCMTCHILRGTKNQSDISFITFAQFDGYKDRIKAHVFDRGNMPLAKIVFEDFWRDSAKPLAISTFLDGTALTPAVSAAKDLGGVALRPGRPIADPGPDRYIRRVPLALSAINSLYASGFNWTIVSNPGSGASLNGANTSNATFIPTLDGSYVVRLTVTGNGLTNNKDITVLVDNINAPTNITFTNIKTIMQNNCQAGCHQLPLTGANRPPISYDENNYPGVGAAREAAFYKTVLGRINFTDVVASPLLRKPSGNHHGGTLVTGFNTSNPIGNGFRNNYDTFVEWIMAGAPL